jgi:hypothetical protein
MFNYEYKWHNEYKCRMHFVFITILFNLSTKKKVLQSSASKLLLSHAKNFLVKGTSREMDLAFDDMYA